MRHILSLIGFQQCKLGTIIFFGFFNLSYFCRRTVNTEEILLFIGLLTLAPLYLTNYLATIDILFLQKVEKNLVILQCFGLNFWSLLCQTQTSLINSTYLSHWKKLCACQCGANFSYSNQFGPSLHVHFQLGGSCRRYNYS